MISLFKQVLFRFEPFIFQGVVVVFVESAVEQKPATPKACASSPDVPWSKVAFYWGWETSHL